MQKLIYTIAFLLIAFFSRAQTNDIVITEIMYNPPESGTDSLEFIELYNKGTAAVDLLDYTFTAGVEFTFPDYSLGAGDYAVIAVDSVAFENNFGIPAFQFQGALSNGGELIELSDASGAVVDAVDYSSSGAWPSEPNGNGSSLVLCDVEADNNDGGNWAAATTPTGLVINSIPVFANPNSASECLEGPSLFFVEEDFEVDEDAGTITVNIGLVNGSGGPYTALVALGIGSATEGEDFSFMETTVMLEGAEYTSEVSLTIMDDGDIEPIEVIALNLSDATGGAVVDPLRADLQISILDNDSNIPDLVINEIMYNNPGTDDYEYIEILNNDDNPVNLEGFFFNLGVIFTFPDVTLQPGDYVLVAEDSVLIETDFGVTAFQWTDGALLNTGETLELRDPLGNVVDQVTYGVAPPWDPAANGAGGSLELCDPDSDNEDPANWQASNTATGVFAGGLEILGSPGLENACAPPMEVVYTEYPIGVVTTNDADGVADSIGVTAQLQGIVYGENLHSSGLQFTLIDENNDGIHVFSPDADFGYVVNEGDEVIVLGTISQFNGLTQINADSVIEVSVENALVDPAVVTALGEETESQLVTIENLSVVDAAQWTNSGPGFNVDVTNGVDTFEMRIDAETDIFGADPPAGAFDLTGIGGQFDNASPYFDGYQILPRYLADINLIDRVIDAELGRKIKFYPNPASETLVVETETQLDAVRITDLLGRNMKELIVQEQVSTIALNDLAPGIYLLTFVQGESIWVERVVKN